MGIDGSPLSSSPGGVELDGGTLDRLAKSGCGSPASRAPRMVILALRFATALLPMSILALSFSGCEGTSGHVLLLPSHGSDGSDSDMAPCASAPSVTDSVRCEEESRT